MSFKKNLLCEMIRGPINFMDDNETLDQSIKCCFYQKVVVGGTSSPFKFQRYRILRFIQFSTEIKASIYPNI